VASTALDAAIIGRLRGDAALMALIPGGVHEDPAPDEAVAAGAFVVVGLVTESSDREFGGTAFESPRYMVKAVASGAQGPTAAANRIDVLLGGGVDNPPVLLTVAGYGPVYVSRDERIRYRQLDNGVMWSHRGGVFVVEAGKG
jgi:hypothetical protein